MLEIVDQLVIGGAMCFTFLAAQGYEVGNSVLEADQLPAVREVMAEAERREGLRGELLGQVGRLDSDLAAARSVFGLIIEHDGTAKEAITIQLNGTKDDNKNTPLITAAQYCGARVVNRLIAGGADHILAGRS